MGSRRTQARLGSKSLLATMVGQTTFVPGSLTEEYPSDLYKEHRRPLRVDHEEAPKHASNLRQLEYHSV